MAELRIQPKKRAPSPWLLVGLALALAAAAAYFFLRPDPRDEAAPARSRTAALDSLNAPARPASPPAFLDTASRRPAAPAAAAPAKGAVADLLALRPELMALADRADLRDDAGLREQRDNFTSATDRLASGAPQASLRPGLVAAASLLQAVQQHGYPNLQAQAADLVRQAGELSGRDASPAEQAQNQQYLSQLRALLTALNQPAPTPL